MRRYRCWRATSQRSAFVTGARESAVTYTHDKPARLLGASLRPGTALRLLGVPAASLADEWQPLDAIMGSAAAHLITLVCDAPALRERLALLDAFVLARLVATTMDERVRHALDDILENDGIVEVEAVGRRAGASSRNLGRLFDDWVGLPPKRFARIVRVQAVMRRLSQEAPVDLATLALEAGFSDQAHLTREMQAIAGIAPGAPKRKREHPPEPQLCPIRSRSDPRGPPKLRA
jgi:AraC-like DNA-binding protein